jgi:hypothetical protein
MRVEPDEQFINTLVRELQIFNFFIEGVMEKIRTTYEMPVPQGGLALKAALRASLEVVPRREKPNLMEARFSSAPYRDDGHRHPSAPKGVCGHHRRHCVRPSKGGRPGSPGFAQSTFASGRNTSTLTIPKSNARRPHPPHRSAQQPKA